VSGYGYLHRVKVNRSQLIMIDQFFAAYNLRLYCRIDLVAHYMRIVCILIILEAY